MSNYQIGSTDSWYYKEDLCSLWIIIVNEKKKINDLENLKFDVNNLNLGFQFPLKMVDIL